ncbi:hypothetical protein HHI36_017691 [Cryptolaemus montrouzieri]|uniref:C2H2-type domain-containing protein n=1 Tax=Cryptolaemus montrouzieri TaxID=559131 RepID=A0ABD2NN50_9CUCU
MNQVKQEPEDLYCSEQEANQRIPENGQIANQPLQTNEIIIPKSEPIFDYEQSESISNDEFKNEERIEDVEYKPILQYFVDNNADDDQKNNLNLKTEPEFIISPKIEPCDYDSKDLQHLESVEENTLEIKPQLYNDVSNCIKDEVSTENSTILEPDEGRMKSNLEFLKYSLEHKHFLSDLTSNSQDKVKGKNYKCHLCSFGANQWGRVRLHIEEVHFKLRTLNCELCSYVTTRKSTLKRHMNSVHATVKCHKCELCEYSSTTKGYIKKHVATVHMKIKNYKCDMCTFTSATRTHLEIHMNDVHFKIKNFKCEYCEYSAARKSNLKKHVYIVHIIKNDKKL